MMSDKLDWTQKLGDAFLAQQQQVMATVQSLRQKAHEQGNLKSSKEQEVIVEQPAGQTTVIKIEPADPQVVYVPTYNPTVVYGTWAYPAYPPYYYYPPGYVAGTAFFSFAAGVAVGSALWGGCNWHGGDVDINVNRYNQFNKTNIANIDRSKVQNVKWNHDATHRKGVAYRDPATAQRFNKAAPAGAGGREAFRGRAEAGRQDLARGAGSELRDRAPGDRGPADRSSVGQRSDLDDRSRGGERGGLEGRQRDPGAFEGLDRGGAAAHDFSNRGRASRETMAARGGGHAGAGRAGGGLGGGGRGGGGRR